MTTVSDCCIDAAAIVRLACPFVFALTIIQRVNCNMIALRSVAVYADHRFLERLTQIILPQFHWLLDLISFRNYKAVSVERVAKHMRAVTESGAVDRSFIKRGAESERVIPKVGKGTALEPRVEVFENRDIIGLHL